MANTQNLTVTFLIVTAAVLTSLLVASFVYTEPAYAHMGMAKAGDYMAAVGAYNDQTDFLYVIDLANNKLNIYYPNINTNSLSLGDTVDLSKAFRARAAGGK